MKLTRLGPYEIGKPLGKGGMGSVYEARNVETGERVAVKALTPHLAMAEGFRERFEAEIESLKALRHEGIVRLYGYGEQDGVLFYSMELVDGTSLDDELKAGRRFNWREVTNIAIQLSLALKHAHDHGIVHRDIKPANVLLYDDDKVKLADFGIARLFGMNQLTTAGGVLGTADYMSPEQADGRPVTARCDQYSLGGVMYALLAGRPPFRATNLPQMLQLQRFAKPEPVRAFAPDTPEQLERVIMQLLAKDPAERFPNMQVLARHLQAMVKALSRPTADDFALVADEANAGRPDADWGHSISIQVTQAEEGGSAKPPVDKLRTGQVAESRASAPNRVVSVDEAATLAAEDVGRTNADRAAVTAGFDKGAKPPVDKLRTEQAAEKVSRFTTVEEEEARRAALHQRSWLVVTGQLAVFVAVLAAMGGVAWYLSRPRSADEIYRAVTLRAKVDNAESLVGVSDDVDEFVARYPNHSRVDEMKALQQQIALDKTERKLQRATGGAADPSLLPIEQMYLRARELESTNPQAAVEMLEAIIELYPAGVPVARGKGAEERAPAVMQLAGRRIESLRGEIAERVKRQREALEERMVAAREVESDKPHAAVGMYRAIVELYGDAPWAQDMVDEARERIEVLEKKE